MTFANNNKYEAEDLNNNARCMQTRSLVVYLLIYNQDAVPPYSMAAQHSIGIGPTFLFAAMYSQAYTLFCCNDEKLT